MKTLYLLRHAEAEASGGFADNDHGRLLSARGRIEARAVGDYMKTNGLTPDLVMGSDSLRTVSTARQVIEGIFGNEKSPVKTHFDRALYLAPADALLAHIHAVAANVSQLLIVAHNPGLSELAAYLDADGADEMQGFPPATLAVYRTAAADWALAAPDNTQMTGFFTPNIA
jgi:phosphohistidine phosphatase